MEQNSDNKKRKKKLLFLVFSLIVVTIGMVVAIALIASKQDEPEIDPRSFEEIFWDSETAEEAIATFQKKIDATSDPEQKASLYAERAETLFEYFHETDLKTNQIISDAKNADDIIKSSSSAYRLYSYLRNFGETEEADVYLAIYLDRSREERGQNDY